jgi:sugar O-acyltransferase (sialic acid O-acetyltransferase NeuD family)
MDQWVVFGFGHYLSDVLDIIHANEGRVKAIVNNIDPTAEQLKDLKRRVALLGYKVSIVDLQDFRLQKPEKYCYGFINGRDKLIPHLKRTYKIKFSNLIHPTAYLGSNVACGEGICVGPHAVVAPNCMIGDFCIINRASSIGHDTVLGNYSTINPGVSVAGMVKIGTRTTLGIGAIIVNDISIGNNSVVGAGSVVLHDIPDGVVVVGNPAKFLKRNEQIQ